MKVTLVLLTIALATGALGSDGGQDDCCMTKLLTLAGLSQDAVAASREAMRAHSVDQRVFLSDDYAAVSGLLKEIGIKKTLDVFHIYAALHHGGSVSTACVQGDICMLNEEKMFTCKLNTDSAARGKGDSIQPVIDQILKLESSLHQVSARNESTVAAYTRWGRSSCPATANLVYAGYVAGAYHKDLGSGANPQCMPRNPIYNRYSDFQWGAIMYPAVYKLQGQNQPWAAEYTDKHAQCAVCEAKVKSTTIMVPGRNQCPGGWTMEYHGYLLAASFDNDQRSMFLCYDDVIEAGEDVDSSYPTHNLYVVGIDCRDGPMCPPYYNARELTCAVCSK